MSAIINQSTVSFSEIKKNIESWIGGLSNKEEIYNNIPASNLSFIVDLIAGYAAYDNVKRVAESRNTRLSTSDRSSSIYKIARCFGYNINRMTAPVIVVRYNDVPTLSLINGTSFGKYGDYDLVYWGEDKLIEKLDTIQLSIGRFNREDYSVSSVEDLIEYSLTPYFLKSIDNHNISVIVDSVRVPTTKDIESYIVKNNVVDWSDTRQSTTVSVSDRSHRYGVDVASTVSIEWIETDGSITFSQKDLDLDSRFIYLNIAHTGTDGDSDEKIKQMAPLYYSTQRRMVSRLDHKYIINTSELVRSSYPDVDPGDPEVVKFTIGTGSPSGVIYSINLTTRTHTYVGNPTDSRKDIVDHLLSTIILQSDVEVIRSDDTSITVALVDTMIAPIYSCSESITSEVEDHWIRPRCCTMHVYYVKYDTVDETPKVMTNQELVMMADFLEIYKMVGYRIVFVPASGSKREIKLKLGVVDPKYWDEVVRRINLIVASYSLQVDKEFKYGVLLAQVGAIVIRDGDNDIKPVTYVAPDQEMFDLPSSVDQYTFFPSPTITPVAASSNTYTEFSSF